MSRSRIAAALAASALLAACAAVPVEEPPAITAKPPPPPPPVAEAPVVPEPVAPPAPPAALPEPPAAARAMQYFLQLRQRPQRDLRQEQERLRKAFAASRSEHDRIRLALALSIPAGASSAEDSQALELLEPLVRDSRSEYHDLASLVAALLTEQRRRQEQAVGLQHKLDRIKALEREMQERSTARDSRPR